MGHLSNRFLHWFSHKSKNFKVLMQPYLKSNLITIKQKQALFSLRNRTYDVKSNFKTMFDNDMSCRNCSINNTYEDEKHIFEECSVFCTERTELSNVKYKHIFGTLEQQIYTINISMPIILKRELLLVPSYQTFSSWFSMVNVYSMKLLISFLLISKFTLEPWPWPWPRP